MVVSHLQWISWLLCETGDQWDCGLWKEGWDGLYRPHHELVPCSAVVHPAAHYTGWSYDRCAHVTNHYSTLLVRTLSSTCLFRSRHRRDNQIRYLCAPMKKIRFSKLSDFYVHTDRFDQETFEQRRKLNLYYIFWKYYQNFDALSIYGVDFSWRIGCMIRINCFLQALHLVSSSGHTKILILRLSAFRCALKNPGIDR